MWQIRYSIGKELIGIALTDTEEIEAKKGTQAISKFLKDYQQVFPSKYGYYIRIHEVRKIAA